MAEVSTKKRQDFVMKLELAEIPEVQRSQVLLKEETFPDNKAQGYVMGGSIGAFTDNVSGSVKQDILKATQLAQLSANKKYNKIVSPVEWYHFYLHVLKNIGFVVQGLNFENHVTSGSTLTMDTVVLDSLAAIATEGQSLVISATLKAFKALPDSDSRVALFNDSSFSRTKGSFQIYPCTQTPGGDIIIAFGCFYFNSEEQQTRTLFWDLSKSKTEMHKGCTSLEYDEHIYSSVRSSINAKLGVEYTVSDIEI